MFCFWEEVCLKDGAKTDTRVHNPKQQYVSRLLYMHICIFVFICMCKGRCAHICTWQLGLLGFFWVEVNSTEGWKMDPSSIQWLFGCSSAFFFPNNRFICQIMQWQLVSSLQPLSGRSQMHRIGKKLLWQFKTALSVEVCQVHCWAWFLLLNI